MSKSSKLLMLIVAVSTACSPTDAGSHGRGIVVHGTSFGMCVGYCTSVLEVNDAMARLIETSRDSRNYPRRVRIVQLTPVESSRLRQLADPAALSLVAGVHGCPDCADGGAEWIEIALQSKTIRTTYDYRLDLDPIVELQTELRSLRQRFQ